MPEYGTIPADAFESVPIAPLANVSINGALPGIDSEHKRRTPDTDKGYSFR